MSGAVPGHPGVTIDRNMLSGAPSITGRRVFAADVAVTALKEQNGRALLREGYDLDDEQINAAVNWYLSLDERSRLTARLPAHLV